jgi:transposase
VSDDLWSAVEPLLPKLERRLGRRRLPDRLALEGILYVLDTGIAWNRLPADLGFGSGFTCWRRLNEWQEADAWQDVVELLAVRLPAASFEWSRTAPPAGRSPAKRPRRARSER